MVVSTTTPAINLGSELPLALLPVRLETRFLGGAADRQLLIRIYPDDLHIESYEPRLTESEIAWGEHFWTQFKEAKGDTSKEQAAWGQLVERFGVPRATRLCEALLPTNLPALDREPPAFPSHVPRTDTWTRTPETRVLPGRWVALGYAGGRQVFAVAGNQVPDTLAVGPSPDLQRGFDAETLANDPAVGWLVDFAAAERVGMGLRVSRANGLPADGRLERLLVFGVKSSLSGARSAELLAELLTAHRYTSGLDFVLQGTPTNNTPEARSGHSSGGVVGTNGRRPYAGPVAADPAEGADYVLMARALGLPSSVFDRLRHADATEQRDAYHMNSVLWKATWGYYLEHLLAGAGQLSTAAIRQAREHCVSYVRGRGPLPVMRVGQQPYGILPIASLDLWPRTGSTFNERLAKVLHVLRDHWRRSLPSVPRLPGATDSAQELLRVLAMSPTSVGYVAGTSRPVALLPTAPGQLPRRPEQVAPRAGSRPVQDLAAAVGLNWAPRIARTVHATLPPAARLLGRLVQPATATDGSEPRPEVLSERDTVQPEPNYLQWLVVQGHAAIRDQAPTPRPDTLLYLLLRHAALLEYLGAAFQLLRRGDPPVVAADAAREPEQADARTPSPWHLMTMAAPGLNPSQVGAYLDSIKQRLLEERRVRDVTPPGAIWRRNLYEVGGGLPTDVADAVRELAGHLRSLVYLAGRPSAVLGRY